MSAYTAVYVRGHPLLLEPHACFTTQHASYGLRVVVFHTILAVAHNCSVAQSRKRSTLQGIVARLTLDTIYLWFVCCGISCGSLSNLGHSLRQTPCEEERDLLARVIKQRWHCRWARLVCLVRSSPCTLRAISLRINNTFACKSTL